MRVLVTGAAGFVGRAVCARLADAGMEVRGAVRAGAGPVVDVVAMGDLGPDTRWERALDGVDAVVHLAARVHMMSDAASSPLDEYRRVNRDATLALARQAADAGVRRFVFASSVKVNGEGTPRDRPFRPDDPPAPADPYGVSKREAEDGLAALPGIEPVVVRPPLVYGPGVRANFLRLLQAVDRGIPLPLGAVDNLRSLVYVGNLADAMAACVTHPAAAGETFLVSDGSVMSTAELVRALGAALGRRPRLLPVPPAALRLAGAVTGRGAAVDRLTGSLVVDDAHLRQRLGWTPPFSVREGLEATVRAYREAR